MGAIEVSYRSIANTERSSRALVETGLQGAPNDGSGTRDLTERRAARSPARPSPIPGSAAITGRADAKGQVASRRSLTSTLRHQQKLR